jgi:hypothetical protein
VRNDFTLGLLNYSAERDDAIGRPERWVSPPPLVVDSPLHDEMAELATEIWSKPGKLIWYFLVGGPGNGKSEAVGKFVRQLNTKAQAEGKPAVFDGSSGQYGKGIPYWFNESCPGGDVTLLQDISVPKNQGSDPAADLLATLDLCADPGSHLLACANRGMLLRATRLARGEAKYKWVVPILEAIDKQSQETADATGAKWQISRNNKTIELRVWPLDHESVLFGSSGNQWAEPAGSLFDQIVSKAVAPEKWELNGCSQCPAKGICPMLGDALWLRDPGRRTAMQRTLRNAEVLSGQRIVLREALGLVSLVLVGSPSDFVEGGKASHPCDWVLKRVAGNPANANDEIALLDLLSRRVYQDLFGRGAPTGLSIDAASQRRDSWVVDGLKQLSGAGGTAADAVVRVDRGFPKHAGPTRLVGRGGILEQLDPSRDTVWWSRKGLPVDGNVANLRTVASAHQGLLEQRIGELFQRIEDAAKLAPSHKDPARSFAALYRWASTLYLRLAGTALGETPYSDSIKDYLRLLEKPLHPIDAAGQQTTLRELMKTAAGNTHVASLAPGFTASITPLQPKPIGARKRSSSPRWPANDRLSLHVSSGAGPGTTVLLTATTFIDTWRKHVLAVADWNIPPAMETLMRSWRDDFVITEGRYRNLQLIDYAGRPPLEFELISSTEIQVRPK